MQFFQGFLLFPLVIDLSSALAESTSAQYLKQTHWSTSKSIRDVFPMGMGLIGERAV